VGRLGITTTLYNQYSKILSITRSVKVLRTNPKYTPLYLLFLKPLNFTTNTDRITLTRSKHVLLKIFSQIVSNSVASIGRFHFLSVEVQTPLSNLIGGGSPSVHGNRNSTS